MRNVMEWSSYELEAWDGIQQRKRKWFEEAAKDSWARRTGERIANRSSQIVKSIRKAPGVDKAAMALGGSVTRLQNMLTEVSGRTVRPSSVLKAYSRRGVQVSTLADLRACPLEDLDPVVHARKLDLYYGGLAALGGGAAGAAITAGDVMAILGGIAGQGAGAAPGFGTVAGAMTADAGLVLALSARAVAHTATYYGFDPNDPREKLFALSVLNVGSAMTQGAKYTALADLSKLTQALARNAPWANLNQFVLARVVRKFALDFTGRLTKQQLGAVVPLVGIGAAAAFDFYTVTRVQEAAYWAYRERFLLEKNPAASDDLADFVETLTTEDEADAEPSIAIGELITEAEAESDEPTASEDGQAPEDQDPRS
jgi:hypothetical protein